MGAKRKHAITNVGGGAGGLLSAVFFCLEQAFPTWFAEWWRDMSWGWLALLLIAFWFGAQVRQWENGDHWLQERWRKRKERATWSRPRYRGSPAEGYEIATEVTFAQHIPNAVIRVETYKEVHLHNGVVWKRIARHDPINRIECNAGDTETIKLIEFRPRPTERRQENALAQNALLGAVGRSTATPDGFYRVVVRVTGTGMSAVQHEFDFWWSNGLLHALPMLAPDAADTEDSVSLEDGIVTLWKN